MNQLTQSNKLTAVLKNTSYLMFAEAVSPLISFLLILVISKKLGTEGMGAYTIVLSVTALFQLFATAGLPSIIVRGIAADPGKLSFYISGSTGVAVLSSVIVLPLMLLALHVLHYPVEIDTGIRLLSYTIVLTTVQQYAIAVCEGLQNMKLRALVSLLDTAGRLASGVFMVTHGYGIVGIVWGTIAVRFATTVLAIFFLARHADIVFDCRIMVRHSYELLRKSLPFLLITITSTVYWSAVTVMLSKLRPVGDVGVYNAAFRIVDILKNVLGGYLIALLPMMSASFARSVRELERDCNLSLKYLSLITVPIAAGISMLAPQIIRLVYGPAFGDAVGNLQILVWTVCAFCLALVFARILVASHHQVFDLYCNIASLAVNIVLGWFLIHRYGAMGAGVATLASLVLFGILQYFVVAKTLFVPILFEPLARAGIASFIMSMAISFIHNLPLVIVIPAGAAVYVAVLVAIRTFSQEELGIIRGIVVSITGRIPHIWNRELIGSAK